MRAADGMIERWHALERVAVQPSPMASPAFALAAPALAPRARPTTFLHESARGELWLAAPLNLNGWRYRPLLPLASSRWSDFFLGGAPLLRADHANEALTRLTDELRGRGYVALELATLPLDGPFMAELQRFARRRRMALTVMSRWRRAVLDTTQDAEQWWNSLPAKRRKEWRRLKRRLGEHGEITFQALAPGDPLKPWLDDFLTLERGGWKGRRGTAIACDPRHTAFVARMTEAFHRREALRFWRLRLNGATIATLFGFRCGEELWLGKIAHDETWNACSPGVLLVIEATRAILAEKGLRLADSAADPHHPMIDHLWRQRRACGDVLLALPGVSAFSHATLLRLERARRVLRGAAKRAWRRFRRH